MSLLMDALRQAETSKLSETRYPGGGKPRSNTADFRLEPIPARSASTPPAILPAATTTTRQPSAEDEENRAAIRNVFAAKAAKPSTPKPLFWLAMISLTIVAIGIAAYAVQQNQDLLSAATPLHPAASESSAARPDPVPASQAHLVPAPAVPIYAANSPSTATRDEMPERPIKQTQQTEASRYERPNQERENSESTPLRLTRTQPEPDANVQRGFANLQRNALDLAQREYELALRNDPNNVDALLGLAAIAQRQGRRSDAEHFQQLALVADPRDTGAQAAALGNDDSDHPTGAESRLKTLLSAQPDSAQLNFALGNVYAKQARWNEAQQVYFNAVAGDTDNPDYLFNLAVSLDQLRQPKLAAQHYRMALEAAEHRPAAFERERINKRLSQLAP